MMVTPGMMRVRRTGTVGLRVMVVVGVIGINLVIVREFECQPVSGSNSDH